MPPAAPEQLDQLIAHAAWLRRLAQRICGDRHLAEDLAQGTLAAALSAPATAPRSRRWFAGILRNLWRQHRRREGTRSHREARAAPEATLPSTADTIARVETQRKLAREVLALAEPERSAILWHFFHALPIQAIAKRLGVHRDTVHKRIRRGLAQLRARLAASDQDHRALLVLAAPLPALAAPSLFGVLLVNTKPVVVGAGLVLAAVLCWSLWAGKDPLPVAVEQGAAAPVGAGGVTIGPSTAAQPERTEVGATGSVPTRSGAAPTGPRMIQGRLLDAGGQPLSDVVLRSSAGDAAATDGRFELPCDAAGDRIRVDDRDWVTMYEGRVGPQEAAAAPTPVVVIAARRALIRGRVIDEHGAAIAGCSVRILPPPDFLTTLSMPLDRSEPSWHRWHDESATDGTFELADVGTVADGTVTARAHNYLPATADLSAAGVEVELVMRRPPIDADAVLGQVLDLFGQPVAGAQVGLGRNRTETDKGGHFRIARENVGKDEQLCAMCRGLQPVRASVPAADGDRPPFVTLWLRAPTLTLAGRVLDPAGNPVSGVRVWADSAELFRGGMMRVESFLGGGATNAELRARHGEQTPLGQLQEEHPSAFWGWTETAADGSFRLDGLMARYYTLGLLASDGLRRAEAGPIAAGSAGVIVTFAPPVHARVSGRVVGLDGRPRQGIAVEASCRVFTARFGDDGPSRSAVRHGPVRTTDADGRFEFASLGARGLFLAINGTAIVDRVVGLFEGSLAEAGCGPVDDLRIEVPDRTHLQVILGNPDLADGFRAVTAANEPLQLANFEDGGMTVTRQSRLRDGKSRVYAVAATAAFVVLQKGGDEVTRIPIQLVPGEVVIVRR